MDISFLEKMISEKNKAKVSKGQQQQFLEHIKKLLLEEGFTDKNILFLIEGIPYGSASVLTESIMKLRADERIEVASRIMTAGKTTQILLLRAMISLLGLFSTAGEGHPQMLNKIIIQLSLAARTQKGEPLAQACKYIAEEFVFKIHPNRPLLPLEQIGLSSTALDSFRSMMVFYLDKIPQHSTKESTQVLTVKNWLNISTPLPPKQAIPPRKAFPTSAKPLHHEHRPQQTTICTSETKKTSDVSMHGVDLKETAATLGNIAEQLISTAGRIEFLENEKKSLSLKLDSTLRDFSRLHEQHTRLIKKCDNITLKAEKTQSSYEDIKRKHEAAQVTINEQSQHLSEASEKLSRQSSILAAFSADKKSSLSAQMCALGGALRLEYEDFQAAQSLSMNIELGENLRGQLQNIFRILQKNGVPFGGE